MNGQRIRAIVLIGLFAGIICPQGAPLAQIANTRHNLSATGPGPIKAQAEKEICVFCHTPHRARARFLWNRADTTATYTTYESSTLKAAVGQPTGASKLCLSCHDGTIALGAVVSRGAEIPFAGGVRFLPPGRTRLGTDISDEHPVSFVYNNALANSNGELALPGTLTKKVRLDSGGEVQCTSCHDPHDNTNGKFLVDSNHFSSLCVTCHKRTNWDISTHAISAATWDGTGTDPWPHTEFTNVAENGCQNCHSPHSAGGHARLLNYQAEEDNCLVCHRAAPAVANTDIESELTKSSAHRVQDFNGIHDPTEDFTGTVAKHVECVDCHNPHRVNNSSPPSPGSPGGAAAPDVSGRLVGVKGITASPTPTQVAESRFQYEICFKCHAHNNVSAAAPVNRQRLLVNKRQQFDTTNPSYHPVMSPGKNPNVPSLLPPYTTGSTIYCTDCHNNNDSPANGGLGPSGPHGSSNPFLLERNYAIADFTQESSAQYALCYKCHDRNSIRGNDSFREHSKHVEGVDAPCSACHDPHGVQGDPTSSSHLINFDLNIVQPNSNGELRFEDRGVFSGACYLSCHGQNHNPEVYP